jgi:hypothetical protein
MAGHFYLHFYFAQIKPNITIKTCTRIILQFGVIFNCNFLYVCVYVCVGVSRKSVELFCGFFI